MQAPPPPGKNSDFKAAGDTPRADIQKKQSGGLFDSSIMTKNYNSSYIQVAQCHKTQSRAGSRTGEYVDIQCQRPGRRLGI